MNKTEEKTRKAEAIDLIFGLLLILKEDLANAKSLEEKQQLKEETRLGIEGIVSLFEPIEVLPADWQKMTWYNFSAMVSRIQGQPESLLQIKPKVQSQPQQMPAYCV